MGISYSKRKTFPATFLPGPVRPLPEGSEDNFSCAKYLECVLRTMHNSFLFNFYMICIYFIVKKIKRTLLKKINILTTFPSHNHNYPGVSAGVSVLKVRALVYRNTRTAC